MRSSRIARRYIAFNLFIAFAFTVMADPVSSVTYAIEAALGALDGDLASITPTMGLVIATIGLVSVGYHGLIGRFPNGGGGPEGLAAAFGESWAFLPLGSLLVDFTLTIAVSCSAGASALIAYLPELRGWRTPLALLLTLLVGIATLFGNRARVVFATATLAFVGVTVAVLFLGARTRLEPGLIRVPLAGDSALVPMLLAMPLGMALATGVEAPSNAIAQLGQMDDRGRRRSGQLTMWLMVAVVGVLTLGLAALTVRLAVSAPARDSTLLADLAERATGGGVLYGLFQASSALLLLAAAASSYLAGSGLLKALALHGRDGGGLLPQRFGRVNPSYVPTWGVAVLVLVAGALVLLAGGREQALVRFYAVAVFVSFLGALVAGTVLSQREGKYLSMSACAVGTAIVAFVLALNLRRLDPVISLTASAAVSLYLWRAWVTKGRPGGVAALTRG